MSPNRFTAFKVSLCGNQIKSDFQHGLTLEQARAYPVADCGGYIWAYALTSHVTGS